MDKEQFDHIETFFRQAAMNVSPPANEEAWRKMEVLLDREFQKKRRRAIFWWWTVLLFFLFLGGVVFTHNHLQPVNDGTAVNGTSPISSTVDQTGSPKKRNGLKQHNQQPNTLAKSNQKMPKHPPYHPEPSVTEKQSGQVAENTSVAKSNQTISNRGAFIKIQKKYVLQNDFSGVKYRNPLNTIHVNYTNHERSSENVLKGKFTWHEPVPDPRLRHNPIDFANPYVSRTLADTSFLNMRANVSTTSAQVKKIRRFYFVAAAGPDASAVRKIHLNKFYSRLGFGIGYQLTKKVSLQTGIYAGRMIYTAGDGDYTLKPGSYISKIIRINADCYFYNVPLSIRYNALQLKKYNLYAVGGLSSFWSKNETYDYHFLNRNGMYRSMVLTYKNNKSLFSATNLSLGFERSLSKSLYLQAESYVLVPVSGVGEGKVKLHSAGLQFGIRYKP